LTQIFPAAKKTAGKIFGVKYVMWTPALGRDGVFMNINEMNNFFVNMKNLSSKMNELKIKTPGTMNVAEIMNRHHLENQHSNIIAFLVNPSEIHNHPEYGSLFLNMLKEKGLGIEGKEIYKVFRENSTDELRRMDIFIETDSDFIIIENKINAGDQENQIKDYVEYVKKHYEVSNNVFVCYLTKFGVEPSEKSITKEQLNILRKNNQFVSLSYSDDVLNWLNELKVKENEDVLKSGIIQYIDVVKEISNKREKGFNMNYEIAKELFGEYGKLDRNSLKEKLHAIYDFQNNINLVLYINLFEDIFKEGKGKISLINSEKTDYKNPTEWAKDVLENPIKLGIRYSSDKHIIDFFVRDLVSNKFVIASNTDDITSDYGNTIDEEGYKQARELNSWFLKAILDTNNWEKDNKLSTHVVRNWFEIK
jgi:hypothetical protein